MKRFTLSVLVAGGIIGVAFGVNGCEYNPFNPPDHIESWSPGASAGGSGGADGGGMGGSGGAGKPCKCEPDTNECTEDVMGECPGGDATACHTVKLGVACVPDMGGAGYCNPDGVCRDCVKCSDATCIDRCDGQTCTPMTASSCKSGNCFDSKCCNNQCFGDCKACDWPDKEGTCTRYPLGYQTDTCNGNSICDNAGACITRTKAALGTTCSGNSVCQSGLCRAEMCRSPVGEPCREHVECGTNLCDPKTKTCMLCSDPSAGSCPTGSQCLFQEGWCQVFPGQPAQIASECAFGANIYNFLCGFDVGADCTAHEQCIYRHCSDKGKCLADCNSVQCANGLSCDPGGSCRMKAGSYCINDAQCQSLKCAGFLRRCQP